MSRMSLALEDAKASVDSGHPSQSSPEPDPDVVLSHLSRERHQAQRIKRDHYFLKGPLPFGWICHNIPDPASRVMLIARAFMDMGRSSQCVLTAKIWDCAGITDRYQRRRVLARLRRVSGDYEIVDRTGRASVLIKLQ